MRPALPNRVADPAPPRKRLDLLGGIIGAAIGLVLGLLIMAAVWGATARSEYQPGTGPCAAAAERWAQLDITWRTFTLEGTQPLKGGEAGAMFEYHKAAMAALEDCRRAGR